MRYLKYFLIYNLNELSLHIDKISEIFLFWHQKTKFSKIKKQREKAETSQPQENIELTDQQKEEAHFAEILKKLRNNDIARRSIFQQ